MLGGPRAAWPGAMAKLELDVNSSQTPLSTCAQGEQWQPALSLLSETCMAKLEPNIMSYSHQNSACENRKQ